LQLTIQQNQPVLFQGSRPHDMEPLGPCLLGGQLGNHAAHGLPPEQANTGRTPHQGQRRAKTWFSP